jgi:cell division protein FtsB
MEQYGDFRSRHQQTVWDSLSRLLILLIAFTFIALIACAFYPLVKTTREQSSREEDLRAEIQKGRDTLALHTRERDLLKNDPTYIETIARDRLDMMKDGETIYRIDPLPAVSPPHFR